jgi:hypothetical protein
MAKPTPRVLRKLSSGVHFNTADASVTGLVINPAVDQTNWEVVVGAGSGVPNIGVWRSYYDTSGFDVQDLTFFPTKSQVQDTGGFLSDFVSSLLLEIISVKPITDEDIVMISEHGYSNPPGSFASHHDLQDIIYARWRIFTISATESYNVISQQGTYGLNTPTGRDRIYVTRIFQSSMADNQYAILPSTAFVLGGVTDDEKSLVHLERLRRNYDHSQNG